MLQEGVAGGDGLVAGSALGHLPAQVLAQLIDRVELGGELGELVVGLGQLALLDSGGGNSDLSLLTLVLATGQCGREGDGLIGFQSAQGVVQAVEHVALANLIGDAGH